MLRRCLRLPIAVVFLVGLHMCRCEESAAPLQFKVAPATHHCVPSDRAPYQCAVNRPLGVFKDDNYAFYWSLEDFDWLSALVVVTNTPRKPTWVSWGYGPDGKMKGGTAVIGIPEEGVAWYSMSGYHHSQVTPLPSHLAEPLKDTSIAYDAETGYLEMKFKIKVPYGRDLNSNSLSFYHLWAYGTRPGFGYHAAAGAFGLEINFRSPPEVADTTADAGESRFFRYFIMLSLIYLFIVMD